MKTELCPECGSEDVEALQGEFELFRCLNCGEVYDENDDSSRERSAMHRERERKREDE